MPKWRKQDNLITFQAESTERPIKYVSGSLRPKYFLCCLRPLAPPRKRKKLIEACLERQ